MQALHAPRVESVGTPEALAASMPAPRMAEILGNPDELAAREAYPVFARRGGAHRDDPHYIVAVTEADALRDFEHTMLATAGLLRTFGTPAEAAWADRADLLRGDLAFMGGQEIEVASAGIARHWLDKLAASQAGELWVGLEQDSSSLFVYDSVMRALEQLDPEAARCIKPVDMIALAGRIMSPFLARIKRAGMVLVDDWTISGKQLSSRLELLQHLGVPADVLEVNVMAANRKHIKEGIAGVACKSYFEYAPVTSPDGAHLTHLTSVTGVHCDTDYGFGYPIGSMQSALGDIDQRLPAGARDGFTWLSKPLLATIVRPYRRSSARWQMPAEVGAVLAERHTRCEAVVGSMADFNASLGGVVL